MKLNAIKVEIETMNQKLPKLTDEELEQVSAGILQEEREFFIQAWNCCFRREKLPRKNSQKRCVF